jgi:small nuclear ribonucleoprotein (snRNP)-like protein
MLEANIVTLGGKVFGELIVTDLVPTGIEGKFTLEVDKPEPVYVEVVINEILIGKLTGYIKDGANVGLQGHLEMASTMITDEEGNKVPFAYTIVRADNVTVVGRL